MRVVAGAFALYLLAAPLQAQIAPVLDKRHAEIVNEIACDCRKSGIEEVIFVPKSGEMMNLTKDPTGHSTGTDEFMLDTLVEENDELIHYHCHPLTTDAEVSAYVGELHDHGDLDEKKYSEYLARKGELTDMLNLANLVQSDNDVGMMIQTAHFFYTNHPQGKIAFRLVSITENGFFVTQYDMKPKLVETIHKIIEEERKENLLDMEQDSSVSDYEFSVKLLQYNDGVFNAAFNYRAEENTYLGDYWDFPEVLEKQPEKNGVPDINAFIKFLNQNTNTTITPLQIPYK